MENQSARGHIDWTRDNKTGEIRIYVDLRKLNDACMHDPFPTHFIDEFLEGVGG